MAFYQFQKEQLIQGSIEGIWNFISLEGMISPTT
jgi:hypothetical protein